MPGLIAFVHSVPQVILQIKGFLVLLEFSIV